MPPLIKDIFDAVLTFATGLVPGALGAAVGLAHEKGLKWSERFIQFAAGTTVSYFAQLVVGAIFAFDPYVLQGIGFSAGMVAFKATPRFIASAAEVAAGLPGAIRDRIFPTKKDKP